MLSILTPNYWKLSRANFYLKMPGMRGFRNKCNSPKPSFLQRVPDFLPTTMERAAELSLAGVLWEHPLHDILQRGQTKEWFGISKTEVLSSDRFEHI